MALLRIVFEGGAWDGRVTQVDAHGSGRAERWAREQGETHVYQRTERKQEVTVEHDTRSGIKYTTESATVFELCERKPSLSARLEARPELAAGLRKAAAARKAAAKKPADKKPQRKGKAKKAAAQEPLF